MYQANNCKDILWGDKIYLENHFLCFSPHSNPSSIKLPILKKEESLVYLPFVFFNKTTIIMMSLHHHFVFASNIKPKNSPKVKDKDGYKHHILNSL